MVHSYPDGALRAYGNQSSFTIRIASRGGRSPRGRWTWPRRSAVQQSGTIRCHEDRVAAEEYLNWTRQWGAALVRTLKPDGTFWLAIATDFAAEVENDLPAGTAPVLPQLGDLVYTFGVNCKTKFSRSHTHLSIS